VNEGKRELKSLAESGTDQIKLRDRSGKVRTGKHYRRGWHKRRQGNYLSHKSWRNKQPAFIQPNHDSSGVIACIRRQKHTENGKQQQDNDPDMKILLHKAHNSTLIWRVRKGRTKDFAEGKRHLCKADRLRWCLRRRRTTSECTPVPSLVVASRSLGSRYHDPFCNRTVRAKRKRSGGAKPDSPTRPWRKCTHIAGRVR
jgi:hypothetical protein